MFYCQYYEILKNSFFNRTPPVAASVILIFCCVAVAVHAVVAPVVHAVVVPVFVEVGKNVQKS